MRVMQISVSLDRNGINATCQHVLAARFDATPDEEAAMQQLVAGSPLPLAGRRRTQSLMGTGCHQGSWLPCCASCCLAPVWPTLISAGYLLDRLLACLPICLCVPADLGQLVDQQLLCKYLKVSNEELQIGSLADAVLLRIAARDC
jgi:hypothetical protein